MILLAIVALFFVYATRLMRQKLKAEHLTMIRAIVGQAVQAAEQYGGDAEEKKRQAIGLAQKWLEDRGIYLDLHDLDAAIEAAVYSELAHFVSGEEATE